MFGNKEKKVLKIIKNRKVDKDNYDKFKCDFVKKYIGYNLL